jgi:hypothetical protein
MLDTMLPARLTLRSTSTLLGEASQTGDGSNNYLFKISDNAHATTLFLSFGRKPRTLAWAGLMSGSNSFE